MTSCDTNDQWLAKTQTKLAMAGQYNFYWPIVGQYDVIFIGTIKATIPYQYFVKKNSLKYVLNLENTALKCEK